MGNEQLSDLTCQKQAIAGAKRKLESEMQTLHGDLDEMSSEARMSEEKAKKAMVDAARLADELRCEQELAQALERDRKLLECHVKEMQSRLDEAESNALKGGKKAMNKMETRIRELESEMDAENRRFNDGQKNLRRSERRIKELTFAADEDRKNHERMQGLIDQLQGKIKSYKKQIEEAEEIAALNLAKFRQAQAQLGECEERADLNEQALAKYKAKACCITCTHVILILDVWNPNHTMHEQNTGAQIPCRRGHYMTTIFFKIQYDKIMNAYAGKGTTRA